MRTRMKIVLALAGVVLSAPALPAQRGNAASYQVVVNANNPVASMEARELSRIFKKEVTRWSDGSAVTPVDQRPDSPARSSFSNGVHGRSAALIAEFWRQQIYSGRSVPPAEKASDAEVLQFVRDNPGAIGYVSSQAVVGSDVKVISVGHAGR